MVCSAKILLKLSKLLKSGQNRGFLRSLFLFFAFFLNSYWILALQTAKIWFGINFLIFKRPYPWSHVRIAWNENWMYLTLCKLVTGILCPMSTLLRRGFCEMWGQWGQGFIGTQDLTIYLKIFLHWLLEATISFDIAIFSTS